MTPFLVMAPSYPLYPQPKSGPMWVMDLSIGFHNSTIPKVRNTISRAARCGQYSAAFNASSFQLFAYVRLIVLYNKNHSRRKGKKLASSRQSHLVRRWVTTRRWIATVTTKLTLTRAAPTNTAGPREWSWSLVMFVIRAKVWCTWYVTELIKRDWKCVLSAFLKHGERTINTADFWNLNKLFV